MCLLAIFYRVVHDAHLVVGANREEFYARPGTPPQLVEGLSRFVAGLDPATGGTWLGVNQHGLLVAVTNRLKTKIPPEPRSRGLLVRDLLGCRDARAAVELALRELSHTPYAGANFICADSERLVVIQAGDWLRVRPLPSGLHLITNHDVNDGSDRRLGHALWWLTQQNYTCAEDCIGSLKELCGQTGNPDPPICLRGPEKGTVSSSIIALRLRREHGVYLHAQGPPDVTPYEDCSCLLQQLALS